MLSAMYMAVIQVDYCRLFDTTTAAIFELHWTNDRWYQCNFSVDVHKLLNGNISIDVYVVKSVVYVEFYVHIFLHVVIDANINTLFYVSVFCQSGTDPMVTKMLSDPYVFFRNREYLKQINHKMNQARLVVLGNLLVTSFGYLSCLQTNTILDCEAKNCQKNSRDWIFSWVT